MKCVRVTTSARLHLGFLDLNGDLGRRFGSIGLAIDAFETHVQLREAPSLRVSGEERERGSRLAARIADGLGLDVAKDSRSLGPFPRMPGLARHSACACGRVGVSPVALGCRSIRWEDALMLDRGARSGVGAALFECGGLVVDAGRGANTTIPPVVARVSFSAGLARHSDVGLRN